MMSARRSSILALAMCLGCGGGDGTYPVTGTVKTEGKPLPWANVIFYSAEGKAYANGADQEGAFTIRAGAESDGLAPGKYKVVVQERAVEDIDAVAKPIVHRRYSLKETTDLEVTVAEGDNHFDLALDPFR